ncbi:hypothetical protein BC829DRAFT_430803 [Chytridium lagenaria]|nr:hypothetical protein BC829DRAFT_430803 [Chytridium lagenaria]
MRGHGSYPSSSSSHSTLQAQPQSRAHHLIATTSSSTITSQEGPVDVSALYCAPTAGACLVRVTGTRSSTNTIPPAFFIVHPSIISPLSPVFASIFRERLLLVSDFFSNLSSGTRPPHLPPYILPTNHTPIPNLLPPPLLLPDRSGFTDDYDDVSTQLSPIKWAWSTAPPIFHTTSIAGLQPIQHYSSPSNTLTPSALPAFLLTLTVPRPEVFSQFLKALYGLIDVTNTERQDILELMNAFEVDLESVKGRMRTRGGFWGEV